MSKEKPFTGVRHHDIRWENDVPVAVTLILGESVEVLVDLPGQRVTLLRGDLKKKKRDWCLHIADFLARQALLKRTEQQRKKTTPANGQPIEFGARPNSDGIWWG